MITIMNQMAEKWFSWQLSMFWQVGLLIVIVAGFDLLIKKWAWPQARYALWLLILVKLILPPTLTSPTSFTAEIPFIAKEAVIKISQPQTMPQAIEVMKKPIEPIIVDTTTHPVEIVPVAPAAPAAVYLSWKVHTFFVWLAGVAILSGWLVIRLSNLRHQHLKDKPQSNLPERLEGLLASTTQKLNLRKVPQVILTNKICCPAVFGVFRPVLLMPADKLQSLTAQDAEHIFLHELAHIKRGDLLVHAIYMILQIAYWFNPLLWLIRKQLQNLRELCCDATVARLLREKTIGYRQTLLETARQLLAEPVDPGLGLLGLFENSGWLVDRLRWLEKKSWKYRPLRIATIFVLISLMAACVLPMTKFEAPPGFTTKGVTVEEGIGFDDIIVGDGNCTIEFIKSRLGQPDEELEDKQTNGYWLNYIKKYGLDFWFNRHKVLYEIRLDKGFKGKLTSGISLASKRQDVFATYGKPISEEFTDNLPKCYGNQILFKLKGAKNSKIYYEQKGLLFWFDGDSVTQIVIHIPKEFSKKTCLSTEQMQNLVEYFFKNNYRDITQRKTIEWGQPTTDKNGNSSIRYKYEARIWDKDKYIFDELFTFSKDDKFVSSKKLSQILVENPVDNDTPAGQGANKTSEQVSSGTGEKGNGKQQNDYSVKLPNGTTVEIVSVCDYPEGKPRCWRPDGTKSKEKLFAKRERDYSDGKLGFIIKVNGPNDFSFAWNEIKGSGSYYGSCAVIDEKDKPLEGFEAAIAKEYKGGDTTNLRVGTATGYWKTIASHNGKGMTTTSGRNILFSQAYESDNLVGITVSSPWDKNQVERIVAVDKDGQTHITKNIGSVASGEIDQMTAKFYGMKLEDIAEFHFQTRPYEWVEFKNVSLKPDLKTDVQIKAGEQVSNGADENLHTSTKQSGEKSSSNANVQITETTGQ